MSEDVGPPTPAAEPAHREKHSPPEPMQLPPWVPTVIGVVLVVMAALAVYTGLRYRNPTLANGIIKRRTPPRGLTGSGAPGEPEPGASLIFPGAAADANETQTGHAVATTRMSARRGMITNVLPDDAMIYVNGLAIGEARQFNTVDEVYDFPAPGAYTIRIVAQGYQERQFVINVAEDAAQEIARLDVQLVRQ